MAEVFLVEGARTPRGGFLESLADYSTVELGAAAIEGVVERANVAPRTVDWVAMGTAIQAGTGPVPARQMALAAGLPDDVETTTVTEAVGSGLRTITLAVDRLESGRGGLVAAGGAESCSNAPYIVEGLRTGHRRGNAVLVDTVIHDGLWDQTVDAHAGELAERSVQRHGIDRERQDVAAVESHERALAAIDRGAFVDEIVPVGSLDVDEGPRRNARVRALSHLEPAFDPDGTITEGNAAGPADGAGCVLLATRAAAAASGHDPLVEVVDYAVAYDDTREFFSSGVDAVEELLARNRLDPGDVAHYELDERFAAGTLYASDRLDVPRERINPRGGGVAFGNPIGATGAMLTTTLAHALADEGSSEVGRGDPTYGVVATGVVGGGGIAVLLRR